MNVVDDPITVGESHQQWARQHDMNERNKIISAMDVVLQKLVILTAQQDIRIAELEDTIKNWTGE